MATGWEKFAEAMNSYPFSIPFLYVGPSNYACILPMEPAPLTGKPVGRSWLLDERGDDLEPALSGYTAEEVIEGFTRLTALWRDGVEQLAAGLKTSSSAHAEAELDNARVCEYLFTSALHFCRVYTLRREWKDGLLPQYREIIAAELENLKKLLPLVEKDARFGYHIEAHGYQFDAPRIKTQIAALESQLAR